jgi:hypothetical protein
MIRMGWRRLVSLLLAAGTLTAGGCTGHQADPTAAAEPTPTSSASHWWDRPSNPVRPVVPSATSPSCTPNQGWTADDQTTWLQKAARADLAKGVILEAAELVCQPIAVGVEYLFVIYDGGGS